MKKLSPVRRKIVLLSSCVACMASGPVLLRNHLVAMGIWIGVMVCILCYALVLLMQWKEQRQ